MPRIRVKLDERSRGQLLRSSKEAQSLEEKWLGVLNTWHKEMVDETVKSWATGRQVDPDVFDLETFFVEQWLNVSKEAMQRANKEIDSAKTQLAAGKIPRSLKALFKLYDQYRKGKAIPKRQRERAKDIQKAYFAKVQDIWKKRGKDWREGETFDSSAARKTLEREMPFGRAQTTARTESTYYYNHARKSIYDRSNDITHYLFVCIRDAATTKWCKTRNQVVYEKDSAVFDQECPPCHWNCRSEILPLSPHNPYHRALIEDLSRARENRNPEPLPPGWSKR